MDAELRSEAFPGLPAEQPPPAEAAERYFWERLASESEALFLVLDGGAPSLLAVSPRFAEIRRVCCTARTSRGRLSRPARAPRPLCTAPLPPPQARPCALSPALSPALPRRFSPRQSSGTARGKGARPRARKCLGGVEEMSRKRPFAPGQARATARRRGTPAGRCSRSPATTRRCCASCGTTSPA